MAAGEWVEARPSGPCEVKIVETDGMGPYERAQRFDAGGHLLFATTRLTYDGRGYEYVTWDPRGEHVVRVDSYYDQDARRGDCEVLGGCDEPARRTIDHAAWRYDDGGALAADESSTDEFVSDRETRWKLASEHTTHHRYRRDHGLVVDERDDLRFDTAGHVTSREHDGMGRRNRDTFEWRGDQLAIYRWFDYTQSFYYDDRGRLAKQTLISKRDTDTTDTWTYDDAGRLTVHARDQYNGPEHHEWTWTYDDAGRLAKSTNGPGSTAIYTYSGTCPANLDQPNLPSALRVTACIRSAGYSIDTCD